MDQRIDAHEDPSSDRATIALKRLRLFVAQPAVRLTARAVELSMDQPNLLTETRIFTDLRPMFCGGGLQIDGAVVLHALQLTYRNAGQVARLSLSMDETDLRRLASQCEKALNKSATMRDRICRPTGIPTLQATEIDTDR